MAATKRSKESVPVILETPSSPQYGLLDSGDRVRDLSALIDALKTEQFLQPHRGSRRVLRTAVGHGFCHGLPGQYFEVL